MKSMELSYCPKEKKGCVKWIDDYFKDCLCNIKDEISFGFGIVSFICWGVAEIPQIVTNFKTKSGHGVSLAFLSTWVVGDIFNLVGCILEPATLPTQFYTALLYTSTTIILVLQCIYYDHFLRWWKCRQIEANQIRDETKPANRDLGISSTIPQNSPVDVPYRRDHFYYKSARSLSRSHDTLSSQSYMKAKSGPSAFEHESCSSSEDEKPSTFSFRKAVSQPRSIPRSLGYGTFLAAASNLPRQSKAIMDGYINLSGRTLLHAWTTEHDFQHNVYGQWLGWLMAAIYMGGRIPQIWLNIKRGNVEGLNPLMFVFALIANATYVGSILLRSTEWEKIKANLPWLLDAIVCVGLDLFIILQYIYYRYIMQKKLHCTEDYYLEYEEANKAVAS